MILLTHGAGSNCNSPLLLAIERELSSAGFEVQRYDLPFRKKRPSGPPRPHEASEDRAVIVELARSARQPVILAGHSYGGRQSSMVAAENPEVCAGLLLFSYPLHPPNKPAQRRTAHFSHIRVPTIFVHGSKDPFGTEDEMKEALALIPAAANLIFIESAGHDLKRGKIDFTPILASLRPGQRT